MAESVSIWMAVNQKLRAASELEEYILTSEEVEEIKSESELRAVLMSASDGFNDYCDALVDIYIEDVKNSLFFSMYELGYY
ncbi:hypothetical protein DU505_09680 [Billgrantia montanilacus]|uniref:Uncharacterized protein n=2 Tax=Billgrantia montanilacus TaxID=2282305 RepID=A0A368TYI4_9GAMM|nr:hypothetical protein DU505_09680 [Halomonas montanilacus]